MTGSLKETGMIAQVSALQNPDSLVNSIWKPVSQILFIRSLVQFVVALHDKSAGLSHSQRVQRETESDYMERFSIKADLRNEGSAVKVIVSHWAFLLTSTVL